MSTFLLTLDTTAPVVTFGPVTDANAGEDMSVEYLVDEPGIDHAEVVLLDARVLPMVDIGTAFTVTLPVDAPEGTAVVHAYTRDDVDNTAEFTLDVYVSGVLPPAPSVEPVLSSMPRPGIVRVSARTRGRARARYGTTAQLTSTSTARARASYLVAGATSRLRFEDALTATSTWRVRAGMAASSAAKTGSRSTVTKRPEGPGHEDELLLLGFL